MRQMKMVADVYSHVIDEDSCRNAELIEEEFYSGRKKGTNEAARETTAESVADPADESDDMATLMRLLQKPEMAKMFKTLAKNL